MKNDDKKLSATLYKTATLVRLTAKHPSGIKVNKALRSKVAEEHGLADEKLVNPQLHVFGEDINKYFRSILNGIKNDFYYRLTLPWSDNSRDSEGNSASGWRLCPNTNLEQLQSEIDKAKQVWDKEVNAFLESYPKMYASAERNLGDLFSAWNIPLVEEIEKKFRFEFEITGVPTWNSNDIRLGVSEKLAKRIEQQAISRAENNIKEVVDQCIGNIVDNVNDLADKLANYDPKDKQKGFWNKSSFDKLETYPEQLEVWNRDVLGNSELVDDSRQKLVTLNARINGLNGGIDSLKDDDDIAEKQRKDISKEMKESVESISVDDLLGQIYGGGKND